jgi:hypothetical protein
VYLDAWSTVRRVGRRRDAQTQRGMVRQTLQRSHRGGVTRAAGQWFHQMPISGRRRLVACIPRRRWMVTRWTSSCRVKTAVGGRGVDQQPVTALAGRTPLGWSDGIDSLCDCSDGSDDMAPLRNSRIRVPAAHGSVSSAPPRPLPANTQQESFSPSKRLRVLLPPSLHLQSLSCSANCPAGWLHLCVLLTS